MKYSIFGTKNKSFQHSLPVLLLFIVSIIFTLPLAAQLSPQPESPEKHFGFIPGTDRMLFDYESLIDYFKKLEKASPRIKLEEIGYSPMGRPMFIVFISSEANIKNLDSLKQLNRKLALESGLKEAERNELVKKGKVFVLGTLSMHSGEVAPTQASPLIAYELATTDDPLKLEWLNNTVYMMVPCHNPDGMDMVVNYYNKQKGTKYEGTSMPGVYHKYVGHDNNRDFVILSQKDTKAIAAIYNLNWFPQVMVEKHQMGSRGPRYYVPPNHDPIAENVDEGIWNWSGIFGYNMIKDMTKEGQAGIAQHYAFDDYWPGSTETCIWKNVIGFLTEAASADYAKPIFVESNELRVRGKGLSEYKKSTNMPLPWPGGWWRLRDIVAYEITSTMSILKTASLHRADILRFRNDLCKKEVAKGQTQPPYHYIVPLKQHDTSELVHMINLLKEHGIQIYHLTKDAIVNHRLFKSGDIVIPLAQPFRGFIKEVMEAQEFPLRHYTPGGEIIKPYDITSWSLPLHRGIEAVEVTDLTHLPQGFDSLLEKTAGHYRLEGKVHDAFKAILLSVNHNDSFKFAFNALTKGMTVHRLTKKTVIGDDKYPEGSFLIEVAKRTPQLDELLKNCEVTPTFLQNIDMLEMMPQRLPRIALVETWFHDMDAGWTRFVFDTYGIPFTVLHPGDFEKTDFVKNFDVVVFPSADKGILMNGKYQNKVQYYINGYPPLYSKGIGKKGFNRLLQFLNKGGIIISWGNSTQLFLGNLTLESPKMPIEEFELPVSDISDQFKKQGLYCPGSLMKLRVIEGHPITLGMQKQIGVFFRGAPVFQTRLPILYMDRRVIGTFPEKNILLSGYCDNEKVLSNQTALAWIKKNKGQLVLFGFNPQFRASTQAAFKLLFNSILLPKL